MEGSRKMKKEALIRAMDSFRIESQSVLDLLEYMDYEAFGKAVELMSGCARIATSGCGHSGIACMHFAHSLCCIERPARFIYPSEAVHGAMGFVQKGDVVIVASRGGKSEELMPLLEISSKKDANIISITENLNSPIAQRSDVVIPMKIQRECDKYNCQSTASFVVLTAIFDALQVALIEETDYANERFALIHPAGAVGGKLKNLR